MNCVRFLGYRKAGRCDLCQRRVGHKGRYRLVRLALYLPETYHRLNAFGICFECVGEWARALKLTGGKNRKG